MNCATSTLKFVVFVFNILCATLGFIAINTFGYAVYLLQPTDTLVYYFCIFGIILGSIVFIVSFYGCCGAWLESTSYMRTYAKILVVLLILQLIIAIIFHYLEFVEAAIDRVDKLWHKELQGVGSSAMADLVSRFQCCGKRGPEDYIAANLTIPKACYSDKDNPTIDNLFKLGCRQILEQENSILRKWIVTANWILCVIEATALVFALILSCSFADSG